MDGSNTSDYDSNTRNPWYYEIDYHKSISKYEQDMTAYYIKTILNRTYTEEYRHKRFVVHDIRYNTYLAPYLTQIINCNAKKNAANHINSNYSEYKVKYVDNSHIVDKAIIIVDCKIELNEI